MLSALDSDFQTNIQYEASVFREYRRLLYAQSFAAGDLEDLTNVLPLPLLCAHLIGQLPPEVPACHAFRGETAGEYAEDTLMRLWGDEDPDMLASFKKDVMRLAEAHGLTRAGAPPIAA